MESEKNHIKLANGNHAALIQLLCSEKSHPEWVTTIAFYKAVQIIEAAIGNRGRSSIGHNNRLERLKRTPFDVKPVLYKHMRVLWNLSSVARYLADCNGKSYTCFTDIIPSDEIVESVIKNRLVPLEQASLEFLTEEGKSLLIKTNPADFT